MSLLTQMEELAVREDANNAFISGETVNNKSFNSDLVPVWAIWFSTIVLTLIFAIAISVNGVTVLIFLRRKKLRHLVNFVLLVDCLSHIILCVVCIPVHLTSVWSRRIDLLKSLPFANWVGLAPLQQVVGNFANLYGTFLSLSIAVLRYRRLCWKKKDKFSRLNAVKWSVSSGILAIGITFMESWTSLYTTDLQRIALTLYAIKVTLIISATAIVFFCYIRVSQRVWANAASAEKVMDPIKLKRSRSVHLRATIHSCVQIILVVATIAPYVYEQTIQAMDLALVATASASAYESASASVSPFSTFSTQAAILIDKTFLSTAEPMTTPPEMDRLNNEDSNNQLTRLIAMTLNYTLLALGTPIAYIASCHRFREQFTSILCGHMRSFYFLSMRNPRRHEGQVAGAMGHHDNNNTNDNFAPNTLKLKSPSSQSHTAEIFENSFPRTRSQRNRSRSLALSPSTMISSVMSTPGRGNSGSDGGGRRASCQSVRVQIKTNYNYRRTNHFFSYCAPQMQEQELMYDSNVMISSGNGIMHAQQHNGINQFVNNFNYSSYGSSSSTSEIVGQNV